MMDMTAYYGQLVGFTITRFRMEADEFGGDPFPTFTVQTPDGETLDVTLSCDPEGNGGGFAFIAPAATLKG